MEGFFVLNKKVLNRINDENKSWEYDVLPKIAAEGELNAYKHHGFWQPMDTLRDKVNLEELWKTKKAPWKSW